MKKLFVLSCVALATLASCSKSEDIEAPQAQKEIAFSVATDKSRAPIEGTSFADGQKIYVSAYNSVSGKYFKGVAFSKDASGNTWKAGQYWPVNGVTSFLAYAATGDVTATWGDDKYADKVEFTLNDGFYNSSESGTTPYIDLLYASGEQAKEKEYDPVSMKFQHTGAWVVFNVKLTSALTDATVTLNSFQLANLFKGGKVVVDNTTYAGAKASWDFSTATAADYDVESFTARTELTTGGYTFGAIIPEQNQTAIKFNYTLSSTGAAFDAQTVNFEYPLSRFNKWEMGKKYVYNITITFNEIEIKPSVTDWGTPNDTAIGI
ncbi:MAG: fimbrillin family protein [Muribaculaceae bacterium]